MNATENNERDEQLAVLIAGMTDALRAGHDPDLAGVASKHPELAGELRELWAVAQFAQLARQVPLATATLPSRSSDQETPGESVEALPRSFGDFELLSELGRGGMGVVYKARQRSLNRIVALKMVREPHLASSQDRARFRTEAESAARLQHPNIVTVFEVGCHDGQAYFCMEYVPGLTLAQLVALNGPLPSRKAARIVAGVARAVQHAHDQGILHRDLKPSNILLDEIPLSASNSASRQASLSGTTLTGIMNADVIPKVTDFGLAKQTDRTESLTRTGAVVGTPSYMAPEQATGRKDLLPATDVYSIGAILYELLTTRPPFRATNPVDTLLQVLEQEPVPPRELNPSVDRNLELVCLKCLQKPADLRYSTAAELAQDLEAYLAGEPMTVETGSLGSLVSRLLRETHHAGVLENWGLLWMWHSLAIFMICLATQILAWLDINSHGAYLALWGTGLLTWGTIFWWLRRRGGPVLFVERQIAHAWAGSVIASIGLFVIEVVQNQQSLTLSPVLPLIAGVVFCVKAGTLSGQFYISALAYFVTAIIMAAWPNGGHLLFGVVSAISFFVPGLKYYRQRKRTIAGSHLETLNSTTRS